MKGLVPAARRSCRTLHSRGLVFFSSWAAALTLAAADGAGLINADMARHISALGAALARTSQGPRRAPDPHELTRLTGRPITGMREFLHASRAQLTGAADSAP